MAAQGASGGSLAGGAGSIGAGSDGSEGLKSSPLKAEFSRLTRTEYAATVRQALGVDPNTSLIPVDGRVGPFTANASAGDDPVHPYLLAGEELAAAVIPARLPACNAAVESCVRDRYRAPIEQLFRRPVADTELSRWAAMISDLTAAGVPALEATRAMLSGVLLSPDFVFRSALAPSGASGSARRVAERLSFTLWDAPPDAQLRAAAEGPAAELGARLSAQAERLSGDARAIPVVARFLAQWLHLDTDQRLADPAFEASPRFREWLSFTEELLKPEVPVTSIVSGRRGFVHRANLAAYGLSAADLSGNADVVSVTWPADSPRRGALGQDLLADATRHPDPSRRVIFRGRLVRASLLCDTIPAPTPELIAAAGEVSDRTKDARCASCHQRMDPVGRAFAGLDPDHEGSSEPPEVLHHAELAGTYPDVSALLDAVAASRAFAQCFARHWLAFLLEQPLSDADPAWVSELADEVASGASLRDIVARTAQTLESRSSEATPWCEQS
jgi:Protein of unknown function (DUF1592)/Protein of unknown function (DUF1588)/Protein of unknown function (DUF1595)/Protein of unknown function (DUF1587)